MSIFFQIGGVSPRGLHRDKHQGHLLLRGTSALHYLIDADRAAEGCRCSTSPASRSRGPWPRPRWPRPRPRRRPRPRTVCLAMSPVGCCFFHLRDCQTTGSVRSDPSSTALRNCQTSGQVDLTECLVGNPTKALVAKAAAKAPAKAAAADSWAEAII